MLHDVVLNSNIHITDRCAAAYFLIAIYGRCRHSDLVQVDSIHPDFGAEGGFLEIRTAHHKTGRGADKKFMFLPILIPAMDVKGIMWLEGATSAFTEAGLSLCGTIQGPLFPAPGAMPGVFNKRPLASSEASSYLRALVRLPEPKKGSSEQIVSSHSCKATMLSWCAKFGLGEVTRTILGRHSRAAAETYAIYSRDLIVAPTRELQGVINKVAAGTFCPDAPRSAFFPTDSEQPAREVTIGPNHHAADETGLREDVKSEGQAGDLGSEKVLIDISDDESSSDSSSGSDASSSESSCLEEPPVRVKRFRPQVPQTETWFVNEKSHILHVLSNAASGDDFLYLACGKRLNAAYRRSTDSDSWNALCKLCQRRKG